MCDQKYVGNFSLKVHLGATAESSRCRNSTRRGSTVSLGFGVASRQRRSARRRKGRWNLAQPREKTPPAPTPPQLTTTISEIEVGEGKDDSSRATAAQGRDNIERWRRLLMTRRPEAAAAVTERVARRAEKRPSKGEG